MSSSLLQVDGCAAVEEVNCIVPGYVPVGIFLEIGVEGFIVGSFVEAALLVPYPLWFYGDRSFHSVRYESGRLLSVSTG